MQTATYCPEDNKLRLYVGRVPRDEYEKLRAQGWTCTPKQDCQFVATWTPEREDTALEYSDGILEDEDQSPQDRAADRAERFSGYREKRTNEATATADRYEAGPTVHGYQNAALAERRADKLDRVGGKAVNLWNKAEYWQQRTTGVISHALHVSTPGVRMGRVLEIEAHIRKQEKAHEEYIKLFKAWKKTQECTDIKIQYDRAYALTNGYSYEYGYHHPRPESESAYQRENGASLYDLLTNEKDPITGHEAAQLWLAIHPAPTENGGRWLNHYRLRLAYENQMLEAQGGRAAFVEMEPGGFIGRHQIQKVNKSPATGRVVSVQVWGETRCFWKDTNYKQEETRAVLINLNIERLKAEVYRPPTEEERAAFVAAKKEKKKDQAENGAKLLNPTLEAARQIQNQMNAEAAEADKNANYPRKAGEVEEMTQARFSGMYKDYRTLREYRGIKIRVCVHGWQNIESVIVLIDKPQRDLPDGVIKAEAVQVEEKQQELALV